MRLFARIFAGALGALLVVALAAGGWLWFSFTGTAPKLTGELRVAGAEAPVRILRDAHGVPHIFAASEADAFFGLGFAQAQDRLFQMDLTRRLMQGRLSELVGSRAEEADARARIRGWSLTAKAQAAAWPAPVRAAVEAYARGVNAAIAAGATSPEYAVLLARPEAWTSEDTAAAALAMTDTLTGGTEREVNPQALAGALSPQQIKEFLPGYPDWAPTSFRPGELPSVTAAPAPAGGLGGRGEARPGSNAWVVSGEKSGTGKPVLANDPHLGLAAPGPFYLVRVSYPGRELVGATLPGAPFVVIGHNGQIAWGTTTHAIDAEDLAPAPAEGIATRQETLRLRDWGFFWREKTLEVRAGADGPILDPTYFELEPFGDQAMQLRSIADDPDNGLAEAVYAIMRADSVDAFFEATRTWVAPPQSLVVASVAGDIGLSSPGRFPLRDAEGRWAGVIPFEGRLEAKNPAEGWFGTGNNLMTPPDYPYPMPGSHNPFRMARIAEVLAQAGAHGPEAARALQGDERSVLAARLQPAILAATPKTEAGQDAKKTLAAWDGVMRQEGAAPVLFAHLVQELAALSADELGPALAERFRAPNAMFLDQVLAGPLGHWCDDVTTPAPEECSLAVGAALDRAAEAAAAAHGADQAGWRWGDIHAARFANPILSGLPLVGARFTVTAPKGGDGTSVNVAHKRAADFATTHAAGLRLVADLADLDASRFQLAPGQSGHPASPHYRDLALLWAQNEGFEIRRDWTPEAPPAGARLLTLLPR